MINAQTVLDQAAMGQIPSSWQVLRARKGGAVAGLIVGIIGLLFLAVFGAVLAAFAGIAQFLGSTLPGAAPDGSQLPGASGFGSVGTLLFAFMGLVWALLVALFLFVVLRSVRMLFLPQGQLPVLVLMPEGCVERSGVFRRQRIRVVEYAELEQPELVVRTSTSTTHTPIGGGQTMARTTTTRHIYLRLHWRNGKAEMWPMSPQFGRPEALAQSIIAAHAQYVGAYARRPL
jgi:hypothetical protein